VCVTRTYKQEYASGKGEVSSHIVLTLSLAQMFGSKDLLYTSPYPHPTLEPGHIFARTQKRLRFVM
jgi:hypothetical protein